VELADALRTTGAVREFTAQPVSDETLHRVLDRARFAPSGGNRQAWRVVAVKDPDIRRSLRDLYLIGWYGYLALSQAGLVPWATTSDREAEARALADAPALAADAARAPGGFAEHLDRVPVLLVLLADLSALATVDRDVDHYPLAGGASVYPFAWSILLSAREEGLGGVITTMLTRRPVEVATLLGAPPPFVPAAGLVLGHPVRQVRRLRRRPVEEFATVDRFDGPTLA
jgi:nitroreductase